MTTITHRVGKSRNLTPAEVDANFDALDASITAISTAQTPVNNLLSTDTTKALAASQGPVLSNSIAVASNSAATASASAASAAATALLADQKATTATANVATLTTTVTALSSTKADLASPALTGNPTVPTQTAGNNTTRIASTAFVTAAVAAVNSGFPTSTSYAAAIPFDGYRVMPEQTVAGAIAFTVNTSGAVDTGETTVSLIADGVNTPTFATNFNLAGSQAYDNTAGRVNSINFFREFGRYYYGVVLGPIIATPTLVSAGVANATPTRVDLTWSIPMSSTISAAAAFTVSGHTVSAHTYVDSTHSYLTVTSGFTNGETARTLAYTQPVSNKMADLVSGNLVASFSGTAIANNVSDVTPPAFSSAAVQSGAATTVEVNFGEALAGYPTSGNLPVYTAFTVSGHTVSAIAWGSSATQIKLTVDAFVQSETRTLAYTRPGTNDLADSSGNKVVNFSGSSITDNVTSTVYSDTGTSDKFGGSFPNNVNPASDGGTWTIDTGGGGTGSCGPSPTYGLRGSLNDTSLNPVRYVRDHGTTTQTLSFNWRTSGANSFIVLRQNGAGGTSRIEVWLNFDTATSQIKETVAGVTSNIGSSFNSVSTFGAMSSFIVSVSGSTVTVKNGGGSTLATATTTVSAGTWSGFHLGSGDEYVNTIFAT